MKKKVSQSHYYITVSLIVLAALCVMTVHLLPFLRAMAEGNPVSPADLAAYSDTVSNSDAVSGSDLTLPAQPPRRAQSMMKKNLGLRGTSVETKDYAVRQGDVVNLTDLFAALNITNEEEGRTVGNITNITFVNDETFTALKDADNKYTSIQVNRSFDPSQDVAFTFSDNTTYTVKLRDASYETDLRELCTEMKINVDGQIISSNDDFAEGELLYYNPKKLYDLTATFMEVPGHQFSNYEDLTFKLPDGFKLPADFNSGNHTITIGLGTLGSLKNNTLTYNAASNTLTLRWNQEDETQFAHFKSSAQAKFTLVLQGMFDPVDGGLSFKGDKKLLLNPIDLHNASVTKTVNYLPPKTAKYEVKVYSDGTCENLTLTDTMGIALQKVDENSISFSFNEDRHTTSTGEGDAAVNVIDEAYRPTVTRNETGTLVISIPKLLDNDELTISYEADMDVNQIAHSGSATFEETGNTAEITGDNDPSDNIATAYVPEVRFGQISKVSLGSNTVTRDGKSYAQVKWQVVTNQDHSVDLRGSTMTDIIDASSMTISQYCGNGVTIKAYDEDDNLKFTREVPWAQVGVTRFDKHKTWTYTFPTDDTDAAGRYKYVFDYKTEVNRSTLANRTVVQNQVKGKCGEAEAHEMVIPASGSGTLSIAKTVKQYQSDNVTWNIQLNVKGESLDLQLKVAEAELNKVNADNSVVLNDYFLPRRTIPAYTDAEGHLVAKQTFQETLTRLEVSGLRSGEWVEVHYGPKNNLRLYSTEGQEPENGVVTLENFVSGAAGTNQFWMEFKKKAVDENGNPVLDGNGNQTAAFGLYAAENGDKQRKISIDMTNSFPVDWANEAMNCIENSGNYVQDLFKHTNYAYVNTQSNFSTASFLTQPVNIYKHLIKDGKKSKNSADTNLNLYFKSGFRSGHVAPLYHYQVAVKGVNTDEPLVIEDTFDTSIFKLYCYLDYSVPYKADYKGWAQEGKYQGYGGYDIAILKNEGNDYQYCTWKNMVETILSNKTYTRDDGEQPHRFADMTGTGIKFSGQNDIASTGATNDGAYWTINWDPRDSKHDSDTRESGVYTNPTYQIKAEDTPTGARFTFENMEKFKKKNGQFYDFYVVDYYLVPKDLQAVYELECRCNESGQDTTPVVNTAECRGKTATARGVYEKRETLKALKKTATIGEKSQHTPVDFLIDINPAMVELNEGRYMEARDVYSDTLSVDFSTLQIVTEPEENAQLISYDFSKNVGVFVIPDKTHVTITYKAYAIGKGAQGTVEFDNTVTVLGYSDGVESSVPVNIDHEGAAPPVWLKLYKYRANHMEEGLGGVEFELLEDYSPEAPGYEHQKTMDTSLVRTVNGKQLIPIVVHGAQKEFTTVSEETSTIFGTIQKGYAIVSLDESTDGVALAHNHFYYLHEVAPPAGYAPSNIYYQFQIAEDGTVDYTYGVWKYMGGDVLTVKNSPVAVNLLLHKKLDGNVILTDAEKTQIYFRLQKKNAETDVWEDYASEESSPESYGNVAFNSFTSGDKTFDKTFRLLTKGNYRLLEYGNPEILQGHTGTTATVRYEWDNNVNGTADSLQIDETTACVVEFGITQDDLDNAADRELTLTNTYSHGVISKTVTKKWLNPDGSPMNWPGKLTVELGVYEVNDDNTLAAAPVKTVTLDGIADKNGENTAGTATFNDLPKFKSDGTTPQTYAVVEMKHPKGFKPKDCNHEENDPACHCYEHLFTNEPSLTITNIRRETSVTVSKAWVNNTPPTNATATFHLFSYPDGSSADNATLVRNVDAVTLDGTVDSNGEATAWQATFSHLPLTDDTDKVLNYIVKETDCTPGYEPSYPEGRLYAANGETITNNIAKTKFTVTKQWKQGGAVQKNTYWPSGKNVTLKLYRKAKDTGEKDESFALTFKMTGAYYASANNLPTGVKHSVSKGTLTVSGLDKFKDGVQWVYYVEESPLDDYVTSYADMYYTALEDGATTGGYVYNTLKEHDLTVSKTVSGGFASRIQSFAFTVTIADGNDMPYSGQVTCEKQGIYGETEQLTLTFNSEGKATFHLMHGEKMVLKAIPGGMRYNVAEEDLSTRGFDASYRVNGGGETQGFSAAGELSRDTEIAFLNTRNATVPTGIAYGAMSSAIVLIVTLGGAALVLLERRARRREA